MIYYDYQLPLDIGQSQQAHTLQDTGKPGQLARTVAVLSCVHDWFIPVSEAGYTDCDYV